MTAGSTGSAGFVYGDHAGVRDVGSVLEDRFILADDEARRREPGVQQVDTSAGLV